MNMTKDESILLISKDNNKKKLTILLNNKQDTKINKKKTAYKHVVKVKMLSF